MLIQTILVLVVSLVYSLLNKDLTLFTYCLYGGFISIANAFFIKRINLKQQKIKIHNVGIGLRIMIVSVVSRLVLVALLVLIGFKLNFEPLAILIGLSIGQVGLIIDILKNKKEKKVANSG